MLYSLRAHLLTRLPGGEAFADGHEPTQEEVVSAVIAHDRMYAHKVLRINYDTYDMRREQDMINPDRHPDVTMYAEDESEHPYLYARVIGVFHLYAHRKTPVGPSSPPKELHVVWVRWFDLDMSAPTTTPVAFG